MNKLRKALALILSLAAILCFPISASALSDGAQALTCGQFARLADKARAVRDALE